MDNTHVEMRLMDFKASENSGDKMIIEGYAIVFEQPQTHIVEGRSFTEIIKSTALDKTDMSDVPLRYNHNDNNIIMARTRNQSLTLTKDERGLKVFAELLDTQSNRDIYKCIKDGLVDKMSFAFRTAPGGDSWNFDNDKVAREIFNIEKLCDVSVVDTPFYDSTSIYARSLDLLDSEKRRLDSLECEFLKEKIYLKGRV